MARVPSAALKVHPEIEALHLYGSACAQLRAGSLGEARTAFGEALRACSGDATHTVRHRSWGLLALAEFIEGALSAADEHGRTSLAVADRHGIPHDRRSGAGHLALAAVAAERGDVRAAAEHLAAADLLSDTRADPVLVIERSVLRSQVDIARGRWQSAVDDLAQPCPSGSGWLAERRAVAQAAVAVAHGDPGTALTVLEGVAHNGSSWTVALAQAHLATGNLAQAQPLLAGLDGGDGLSLPDRVRLGLLRSRAALLDGDRATARDLLVQAVDSARPERLLRPFKEAGPWVRRLLDGHGELDPARVRLTAGPPQVPGEAVPVVVEELSTRERQVLAEVARLMSTDEIAAELGLSVNTVKTHLRSIFRKLCVTRRRDAVDRARELHIL